MKKYRNRHLILKTLQDRRQEGEGPNRLDISEVALTFSELVEKCRLTESELVEQIHYLKNTDEVIEEEIINDFYYFISQAGTAAYYDNKYLNKGKKELLENTYDVLKNLSTIILLLIAIITFTGNWISSKDNKSEIDTLKFELKQIKDSIRINKTQEQRSR
jgi:hypothetical protein